MKKQKIAFICHDNTFTSQIAEAITKIKYPKAFQAYSAGIHPGEKIDLEATKVMKELFNYDLASKHKPMAIADLRPVDIVITFNVHPDKIDVKHKHHENWDIGLPKTFDKDNVIKRTNMILSHITLLKESLEKTSS